MEKLDGIHHISAITADATKNLLFYEGVMGLRLVKQTVNQDNPSVYHLFMRTKTAARAPTSPFPSTPAWSAGGPARG